MTQLLNADLPEALRSVTTRSLFVMHLDVRPLLVTAATPGGFRRVGVSKYSEISFPRRGSA
jgi:hypothetical protein